VTVSTERPATYRDVFAVREFRVLFAGFSMLLLGDTVKMLALSVLVYSVTGSPVLAALAYVSGFLPYALGGTFLLALADRWRPRAVMVGYDLLRLTSVAALAIGVLPPLAMPPLAMLALVFAVGIFAPVSSAARTALLPDLLDGDRYVLGRSLFTVTAGAAQVLGFGLGGLLLALVGPYGALWLTAASCTVSALLVRFGLTDRPARTTAARGLAVRETWRVNRALLGNRRVRGLLLAQWLPVALMVGGEGMIVPYASALGAESAAGVLFMCAALGMLLGDLAVGRLLAPRQRERLTPWLALLLGVPLLGFLLRPGLAAAGALFLAATAGISYQLGLARRFLAAAPEATRGQAFGLSSTGLMTLQGLTVAAAGGLGQVVPPATAIAAAGAASLLATVLLWKELGVSAEPANA